MAQYSIGADISRVQSELTDEVIDRIAATVAAWRGDDTSRHSRKGGNPTPYADILICRSKTRTMVEYALRTMTRALGIATYTVTPQLPASFQGELPSPEQIAERLAGWALESDGFEGEWV